ACRIARGPRDDVLVPTKDAIGPFERPGPHELTIEAAELGPADERDAVRLEDPAHLRLEGVVTLLPAPRFRAHDGVIAFCRRAVAVSVASALLIGSPTRMSPLTITPYLPGA